MRCERDGATTQKIVQETPVIIDGRRGKYVTEIDFTILDPSSPQNMPSMVEFTQEMPIEEAKRRWPNTKISGRGISNEKD
jgi:hypothetical protein